MKVEHLPPTFTWNEYLEWAERIAPDATYNEVRGLFDLFASKGLIVPCEIDDGGSFIYELQPTRSRIKTVTVIVEKGLN